MPYYPCSLPGDLKGQMWKLEQLTALVREFSEEMACTQNARACLKVLQKANSPPPPFLTTFLKKIFCSSLEGSCGCGGVVEGSKKTVVAQCPMSFFFFSPPFIAARMIGWDESSLET